jgi:ABC-type polysaccharide/polyol phosphate export permease
VTTLNELVASRELMANLTLRELRGKYKRSVLGWGWSLLNPLLATVIYTVVFRLFLRIAPPIGSPSGLNSFALFLLCGLLPWNFVSSGLTGSIGALVANGNLIKKVWFPREILIAASVVSWNVSFLIELGVLAAALLLFGNMVLPWIPVVLVLLVIQTVFVLGLSLMLSVLNVYFRDVQHFVGIFLQVWFYATPVIYPIDQVPAAALPFYELNPMVHFVEAYRDCWYHLRFPGLASLAYMTAWAVAALVVGLTVFTRLEPRLAEEL